MPAGGKFRILMILLLAVATTAVFIFVPVQDHLLSLLAEMKQIGPWGAVWISIIYIPACLLFIPGSLITLGAGFAFGPVIGTLAVSVGSVAGATAAFLMGRTLARGWISRKVMLNPKFQAIDSAVGERGFRIVLLTRLSLVFPFNLLNYAFGLTNVRLRDYVLASWIGMLPGTILYVYAGSAIKDLAELASGERERSTAESVLFFAGLLVTIIVTVYITRIANRALKQSMPKPTTDSVKPGDSTPDVFDE
ncbi:MAG: TVP38/TMEM64 family protein [Planctomycetaceae bacterium]